MLTVRELARLQGFKDNFVFYGSLGEQYVDVLAAQPPAIGNKTVRLIKNVVDCSRTQKLRVGQSSTPSIKRLRTDNGGRDISVEQVAM